MLTSDLHTAAHICAHTTLPHTQKNIAKDLKPKKRTEEQTKKNLERCEVAADALGLLLDMAFLEQWENENLACNNYTRAFCRVSKVLPMFKIVAK